MPANINKTETDFFIALVFYVVFKHTEFDLELSCKGNNKTVKSIITGCNEPYPNFGYF